ncbi:unnamed protein product [Clonostachys byssicola]|uniref:Zn(2)-C6 fungal-type domain-containing protein n=1 Tax=Clonostachys byssicola TaxID=160290 RepID=A0A9N9XZP1_9HYPO|nr:unnamed protein product [Clonostachys byssicola]
MVSAPAATLRKACAPCHTRKIKCDAAITGLPCGRCIARGCSNSCMRPLRHPRARKSDRLNQEKQQEESQSPQAINVNTTNDSSGCTLHVGGLSTPEYQFQSHSITPQAAQDAEPITHEDQARMRTCHEISGGGDPVSASAMTSPGQGRDTVEYRNGLNFISALGELVGNQKPRRLTRIMAHDSILDSEDQSQQQRSSEQSPAVSRLGAAELALLESKGALSLPPKLLKLYFEICYVRTPIFNRVEFCRAYESDQSSLFLMNAVFANAAQYAPIDLIERCGFNSRSCAQRAFIARAILLYDLGHETVQLRLLQGSVVLGATVFSYTRDKDFRFWMHNASRLAVKMGLHLRDIEGEVDPDTFKLCRRIWWAIYSRDIILHFTGLRNMRMLDRTDYDMTLLSEDDWESDESIPDQFWSILSPITRQQKLFHIEYVKLTLVGKVYSFLLTQGSRGTDEDSLGEECLSIVKSHQDFTDCQEVEISTRFSSWRKAMPHILSIDEHPSTPGQNRLPITLIAASYRFECILYHVLQRKCHKSKGDAYTWCRDRLRRSIFQLDTLIGRAITDGLSGVYSQTLVGCVNTSLALRIESSLQPQQSHLDKMLDYNSIRQSILFLREVSDLPSVQWPLGVFEWILGQKGLFSEVGLTESRIHGLENVTGTHTITEDEIRSTLTNNQYFGALETADQLDNFLYNDDFAGYMGLGDI